MPSVSLLFLCIFILHLIFVCGSVLFSQVTNVSNTNLIFSGFGLCLDTPPINASHQEAPSNPSIKDLVLTALPGLQQPAPAPSRQPPSSHVMEQRAEPGRVGGGNGSYWKDPGKRGASARQSWFAHRIISGCVQVFFPREKGKPDRSQSVAQLNAKKDLCVSQAPIYHGPACPWSYRGQGMKITVLF